MLRVWPIKKKNSLKEFSITFEQEEKRISKLEDRTNEIIKSKEQKEKKNQKIEQSLGIFWDTIRQRIYYESPKKRTERKKEAERLFKKKTGKKTSPNLTKDIDPQIQEVSNPQI